MGTFHHRLFEILLRNVDSPFAHDIPPLTYRLLTHTRQNRPYRNTATFALLSDPGVLSLAPCQAWANLRNVGTLHQSLLMNEGASYGREDHVRENLGVACRTY